MAAHQAPPSLGFSRQEHWSGLPFLSPMHESEKWKWSLSVMSDSATPCTEAYQAPPPMGFSRQEYWSGLPLPSPTWDGYKSLSTGHEMKKPGDPKWVAVLPWAVKEEIQDVDVKMLIQDVLCFWTPKMPLNLRLSFVLTSYTYEPLKSPLVFWFCQLTIQPEHWSDSVYISLLYI